MMETMKISGKDYAKVVTRVAEFHKLYPEGRIYTEYDISDSVVVFKATIHKTIDGPAMATGHGMGAMKGSKALEKTESISVGRALAFLGIMADGSIATAEEMQDVSMSVENSTYRIEGMLEGLTVDNDRVKKIREGYAKYNRYQLNKAIEYLSGISNAKGDGIVDGLLFKNKEA